MKGSTRLYLLPTPRPENLCVPILGQIHFLRGCNSIRCATRGCGASWKYKMHQYLVWHILGIQDAPIPRVAHLGNTRCIVSSVQLLCRKNTTHSYVHVPVLPLFRTLLMTHVGKLSRLQRILHGIKPRNFTPSAQITRTRQRHASVSLS